MDFERQVRREIRHERELREQAEQGFRRALKLQATEYARRLSDLNHEKDRLATQQSLSVTADKFDDYKKTQETALKIALDRQDERLNKIENWRSKATGIGAVLVLFSGAVGAAIMRALGG